MTGWRLGYVMGPRVIIDQVKKIHQFVVMSAPTISQYAGLEASHESVLNFLDKELEDANIKPDTEEVEETETEEDIEETEIGDETND